MSDRVKAVAQRLGGIAMPRLDATAEDGYRRGVWLSVEQAEAIADALGPADLNRPGIERAAQVIQSTFGSSGANAHPSLGAKLRARQIVNAYFEGAAASLDPLQHAGRGAEVATDEESIQIKSCRDCAAWSGHTSVEGWPKCDCTEGLDVV